LRGERNEIIFLFTLWWPLDTSSSQELMDVEAQHAHAIPGGVKIIDATQIVWNKSW